MRRRSLLAALLVPAVTTACATGGGGGSSNMMGLSYGVPEGGTVTYDITDETTISVDAGGQMIEIPGTSSSTMTMSFAEAAGGGVTVTATFDTFEATLSNPMGAAERGTLDDIDGPIVFELDPMGNGDLLDVPGLSGSTETLLSPESYAYDMFPGLPGGQPSVGMTWADTVMYEVDRAGTYSKNETVTTYTVAGEDETTGYLRIDYTSTSSLEQEGAQMGMSFVQSLAGGGEGYILWNLEANRMEEHHSETSLEGVMDMDQMPVPFGLNVTATQSVVRSTGGM